MADDEQASAWNWRAFGAVALGVIQITAGVALQLRMAGSLAATGVLLIRQGSYDIIFAIRAGIAHTFSWTEYALEKLISIPFTVVSIGVERWLYDGAGNAFRRSIAKVAARKVSMVLARGVTMVCLGKALRVAKDAILEKLHGRFEAATEGVFAQMFVDLQEHVENLFRSNPANAGRLISEAYADVVSRFDEEDSIFERLRSAAVEFLPALLVELGLKLMSRTDRRDFGERTMDSIKFATLSAISAAECCVFARNFLTSLNESLRTLCQQNQAAGRRELASPAADAENVEEFTDRFERRVKACVVRNVGEKFRRGLLQATAQSFVLGILM